MSTIEAAAAAGLMAIGLEAQGALIIDMEECIKAAQLSGVLIYGFPKDWGIA